MPPPLPNLLSALYFWAKMGVGELRKGMQKQAEEKAPDTERGRERQTKALSPDSL